MAVMLPPGDARYDLPAIVLHWVLALAIAAALACGLYAASLPVSIARLRWINWHKWLGIAILAASLLRLAWRLYRAPPALPAAVSAGMPGWQHAAHRAVHGLLYALFFAVPLAGWAYSSASGFQIVWLGRWPLPDWVPADKALAQALQGWHAALAYALAALVLLHVAAVLKHQWLDRDGLLARMWPRAGGAVR